MRSQQYIRKSLLLAGVLALGGCLVSEEPVLGASNGRATPLEPGAYVMCAVNEDEDDCQPFDLSYDESGLYSFEPEDEDPVKMRFRRIGRQGYAVQSHEDDGYLYYYGAGNADLFRLTMMMCSELPEHLRARLINRGDLEAEDDDFETCIVKTRKGLTAAARAYHRGNVQSEEEIALEFTRAPESP